MASPCIPIIFPWSRQSVSAKTRIFVNMFVQKLLVRSPGLCNNVWTKNTSLCKHVCAKKKRARANKNVFVQKHVFAQHILFEETCLRRPVCCTHACLYEHVYRDMFYCTPASPPKDDFFLKSEYPPMVQTVSFGTNWAYSYKKLALPQINIS